MSALRRALRDLPEPVYVDVLESENAYRMVVDLPGVTPEMVTVDIVDGRIEIEAQRPKEVPEGFTYRSETRDPILDVELPLPEDATGTDAEALVDRGILTLTLPKTEDAAETVIPIEDR